MTTHDSLSQLRTIAAPLFAAALLGLSGCSEPTLDSPEYGELIYEVPPQLNRPYPLPELEAPAATAAPGPQASGDIPAEAESASK